MHYRLMGDFDVAVRLEYLELVRLVIAFTREFNEHTGNWPTADQVLALLKVPN